jgi:hypothetical protein
MTLSVDLLEHLQRKGCAMTVLRLAEDFKKPPQVIEANLAVLRRDGRVQILRPGEWEITPAKPAAAEVIPPEPPRAIALAQPRPAPPATTDHQETTMSYKTCEKCKGKKGPRAFDKGEDVCRECQGGKRQGGGSAEAEGERQRPLRRSHRLAARRARRTRRRTRQDRRGDRAARSAGLR